jgi:hypothetical protein
MMFVSDFKNLLTTLPEEHNIFMQHIEEGTLFCRVATEFFLRITNYALNKSMLHAPSHYNSDLLCIIMAVSRFPIEMLGSPEEPFRFTLLNKTIEFLETVDAVLRVHSPDEDDTCDAFLDEDTVSKYLHALNEVCNALNMARCCCGCFLV